MASNGAAATGEVTIRLAGELASIVGEEAMLADEPMANHTTFKIGGPATCLVLPQTPDQVEQVVAACVKADVVWRVIGLGSDLLVSDEGLPGVTIQIADAMSELVATDDGLVIAYAGASNASVAEAACARGLAGYEFACGIPGTIGGAAIMNAGAYGGEFKDVAVELACLDRDGSRRTVSAEEADWSYRHSMMDDEGMVILSATLKLHADDPVDIRARMDDLAQRRAEKQPLEMPSAGSTFKRPEGHFAGKLIQDAGLQGYRVGGAEVSTKHAGFVVNAGGATAEDVLQLIRDVQQRVYETSGVSLQPEVRLWGFENEAQR